MKRSVTLLALLMGLAFATRSFGQFKVNRVSPVRVPTPPRIDGRLDDAAWRTAAVIADIPTPGRPDGRRTSVKLVYDDTALYAGWICHEHAITRLVTGCTTARDKGWGDDSVEVFVQPRPPKGDYFQVLVTAANILSDNHYLSDGRREPKWDGAAVSAVSIGEKAWFVEMAIPWADFGLTSDVGSTMGLHLARWQPIPRGVNSHWGRPGHPKNAAPEAFGRMDGVELNFAAYSVAAEAPRLTEGLCFGANRIPVTLKNLGTTTRRLRIEGEAFYADGSPMQVPPARRRLEIAPKGEMEVGVVLTATERRGTTCGRLRVVDEESGLTLRQMVRYAPIPEELLRIVPSRRYLYESDVTFEVRLYADVGEASLRDYRLRVRHPTAGKGDLVRHIALTAREAAIPLSASALPLGDVPITFEVIPAGGGKALDRVATKVVRLVGPFDREAHGARVGEGASGDKAAK